MMDKDGTGMEYCVVMVSVRDELCVLFLFLRCMEMVKMKSG